MWSRICSATVDNMVPSLYGFFENLKYIKLAADCMKRLVCLDRKGYGDSGLKPRTIREAMENAYTGPVQSTEGCPVRVSGPFVKLLRANGLDTFDISYRQLWLNALREHPAMPAEVERKKSGGKTVQVDETVLFRFASLAHGLGFRTNEIRSLLWRNPDREIARPLLTMARRRDEFYYEDIEACISTVEAVIASEIASRMLPWPQPASQFKL